MTIRVTGESEHKNMEIFWVPQYKENCIMDKKRALKVKIYANS